MTTLVVVLGTRQTRWVLDATNPDRQILAGIADQNYINIINYL